MKHKDMKPGLRVWIETPRGKQQGHLTILDTQYFVSPDGGMKGWYTSDPNDITEVTPENDGRI